MNKLRLSVCLLAPTLVGAFLGGWLVYDRIAIRDRRQYENALLSFVEGDLSLAKKLRSGKDQAALRHIDRFVGQAALGLRSEVTRVRGVEHVLWQIKTYYRTNQITSSAELDQLFQTVSDDEPTETRGTITDE